MTHHPMHCLRSWACFVNNVVKEDKMCPSPKNEKIELQAYATTLLQKEMKIPKETGKEFQPISFILLHMNERDIWFYSCIYSSKVYQSYRAHRAVIKIWSNTVCSIIPLSFNVPLCSRETWLSGLIAMTLLYVCAFHHFFPFISFFFLMEFLSLLVIIVHSWCDRQLTNRDEGIRWKMIDGGKMHAHWLIPECYTPYDSYEICLVLSCLIFNFFKVHESWNLSPKLRSGSFSKSSALATTFSPTSPAG